MSEIVLFNEDLKLTLPAEASADIIVAHTEAFAVSKTGDYADTFASARKIFEKEGGKQDGSVYYVPAVRFLLKTGLDLLAQAEVKGQLPAEVEDRQRAANFVVGHLAEIANENSIFTRGYKAAGMPTVAGNHLDAGDTDSASSLAQAAFLDASILAGGATKLLREQEVPEDSHLGIIQGSYGLLKMSAVKEGALETVHRNAGMPYVHTGNLRLSQGEGGAKVRFAPRTQDMIKRNIERSDGEERGCPAGKMKAGSAAGTVLQEDWRDLVAYLVPLEAAVENYTESEPAGEPV
ncbi:MAG TPA: hypothetical protein VFW77_03850 [Candidatus Saccharimonadales bacterium]|nr:hypothetical protein [Candidatus Saccharimonadales bacterium]